MSKKKKTIIFIILITIVIIFLIPKINKYLEKRKIANAKINIELKNNLKVPFGSEVYTQDFISSINGQLTENKQIDTESLGTKTVSFEYINDDKIKVPYQYEIDVIDNTPPLIWLGNTYTILTSFEGKITDKIMCVDDLDDKPDCHILGDYDIKTPGRYNLTFEAVDKSGNKSTQPFTLIVKEPTKNNFSQNTSSSELTGQKFEDIIANYKTDKTKIGIDVSGWQGDIDFQKVKDAGVEFVFIKVGGTIGIDGKYYVDSKFKRNIEGFNKVGIPVGVYVYTYAKTSKNARADALWVMNEIKNYKVDLPIVYDWENWSFFNEFELSLNSLTNNAKTFFDTIEEQGYTGALYSSKTYLEKVWMNTDREVWLAHYTKQTSYEGSYKYWQMCDDGLVDGINGHVDINIMYK